MRPLSPRRWVAIAAAAALSLTPLAACSSTGESADDGPVDLRMVVWSANESHHEVFQEIADSYVAEHPDEVRSVTFETLGGGTYINALTTQIAGGQAPDMAWVSEAYATQFVDAGVFTDLSPTLEATEGYRTDDLIPGAMTLWTRDSKIYGYPFSNSPLGIYVNEDLLKAAGQPSPRDLIASGRWTWDELMRMSAATASSQQVAGFQLSSPPAQWIDAFGAMWLAWGGRAWSDDGRTCTMNSPEMVQFFEWYHRQMFETGAATKPGEKFEFTSGQVTMKMGQLSSSAGLGDDFEWDWVPLPSGPKGDVPVVGQAGVGVLTQGRHPEQSARFLAYFTNEQNAASLAQFFPPPRASLLTVETLQKAAPSMSAEQLQTTLIDQSKAAVTKEGNPHMSDLQDPVRAALDSLWTPTGDARTALDAACEAMAPALGS